MTSQPRVSVVVPFLDPPEAFMTEALDSVLAQTFQEWELLLVNDGSGEAAGAIAEDFIRRSPNRVRLLSHPGGENRGISASRNLGIEEARGEFLAFLDADDVWLPGKLGAQVQVAEAHPDAALLFGSSLYWRSWTRAPEDLDGDFVPRLGVPPGTLLPGREALRGFLTGALVVPCPSSVLARTDAIRAAGAFESGFPNLYEDQAFYAKVCIRSPVVPTGGVWDRYRLRPDSTTGAASADENHAVRGVFLDWLRSLLSREGIRDPSLQRLIAREEWALRYPLGGRLLRSARRSRRRARHLLSSFSPSSRREAS